MATVKCTHVRRTELNFVFTKFDFIKLVIINGLLTF